MLDGGGGVEGRGAGAPVDSAEARRDIRLGTPFRVNWTSVPKLGR